jgi:hypothetical protein
MQSRDRFGFTVRERKPGHAGARLVEALKPAFPFAEARSRFAPARRAETFSSPGSGPGFAANTPAARVDDPAGKVASRSLQP